MNVKNKGDFQVLPPRRGQAWLFESLRILRTQAARLLLIAVLMQLILSLVQVPLLGLFVILAVPALTAGILEAFHRTGQGVAPALSVLFLPLASGRYLGRLFAMGGLAIAISILCVSFVMGSTTEVDEALLMRLQQGDMSAMQELDPTFMTRLAAAFAISVAVSGTLTFFSIPLVWFRDRKLWPAIGQGIKALLANWKPMLVLGLGLVAVFLPFAMLMLLLMQLAMFGSVAGTVGTGLAMMLLLLFQLLLFGTQYCSFREVFGMEPQAAPEMEDDGSQLLA